MAQFVLGVDLEIQKVLGLADVKQQLAGITINTDVAGVQEVKSKLTALGNSASAISPSIIQAGQNLANLGVVANKSEVELDNLIKSLGLSGGAFKVAADPVKTFGDQIFLAGKRYAAFVAATALAFKGTQLIGEATKSAIEFESELVRLDQILDEGAARLDTLKQKFLDLSVVTGTSVKDLAEVATILAQAGLGNAIDAALEPLSKVPLLPAFKDMKSTTEGLIAVFKQFGLQGSDTSQILDLLNETANKFAVTSEDIVEGIKRGGAAFAATGGTLKEFIQLFTTIRQVTQLSAETVGTAIKTISARVFQPTVFKFLEKEGITVIDKTSGAFVGLNNILLQVAKNFENLSVPRQAEFARQLGGIRQIGQVFAALRNPQLFAETGAALQNATGSAAKDAAKALETTSTQLKLLTAEANKLVLTLAPDLFLPFIKSLIKVGEIAVHVVDVLSPLIPLITAIGGLAAAKGLAGIGSSLLGKITGAGLGGGALGQNLDNILFGQIGNVLGGNNQQRISNRLAGGVGGAAATSLVGQAQNKFTQNPLLGIASTAVLGTLTAQIFTTQKSIDVLGAEASKTAKNIVQFSTTLVAAIALLRGQSITQTIKGLTTGAGALGGIALGIGILASAHADALNDVIDTLLNEAVESIRKINFPSLNLGGAGLDRVQKQIGLLSESFITSAGFGKIEDFDISKGVNGLDVIVRTLDNVGSVLGSFLSLDFTPLTEGLQGRTIGDTRRVAAIKQFVEANLGQFTALFDETIKQNIGDTRNAFIAGLQNRTGVSPEVAQNVFEEFQKQLGGKEVVSQRIEKGKQASIEEKITKDLQRIQRDFESIIIPSSLTGDLIQFGKAIDLVTRQIDISASQFSAQIGTIQGIGQGNLGIQPTRQEVLDLFKTGGLDFLFKNQQNIPKFVNGLTEIEDAFTQFTIRISNLNLKELNRTGLADQIESFFQEQINLPPGVKDEFKAFFDEIGQSLQDAAGERFISPEEITKKISDKLTNLGIKTRDTVVEQTTRAIEGIFIQIQDRVNRLATLRKLELESNILPESQIQFLIDQLSRAGVGVNVGGGVNRPRGTIEQFQQEANLPGRVPSLFEPPESFFKDFSSRLTDIVLSENTRRQLTEKFLSVTSQISSLRDNLARLQTSGQGGSIAFETATNKLLILEKQSVELQTAFEALKNATNEAQKSAVEELNLRQAIAKQQFEAQLQTKVREGVISPEDAARQLFNFNEEQIKARQDLDRQFQTILQEDGQRRLDLARIIDQNTSTQVDATKLFQNAVVQFGQAVLQFTTLSQLPATPGVSTAQIGIPTITPEQVRSGAVTSTQALEAINTAVTQQGNDQSRQIQDLISAWRESLQRDETVRQNQVNQQQQQPAVTNDKLIGQLDNLNKNLQEPGNVKLETDNLIKFDVTGLPAALVEAVTPKLQEAAETIARITITKALESLAAKTDIETSIAIQGVVRELNA
jgi:TP901 family phage tail tape measure protein